MDPDSQPPRPGGDLPPLVAAAYRLLQGYAAKQPGPTADMLIGEALAEIRRQLDGVACIYCSRTDTVMVPAGHGPRGQLFACSPTCPTP